MKKLLALFLVCAMISVVFVGCGKSEAPEENEPEETVSVVESQNDDNAAPEASSQAVVTGNDNASVTESQNKAPAQEQNQSQAQPQSNVESSAPVSSTQSGSSDNSTVSASFKSMMDEYEAFFNDYVEFMKKYKNASAADLASMLKDYSTYMTKYADYLSKLNGIDSSSLSAADLVYYNQVNARILNKLAEIA